MLLIFPVHGINTGQHAESIGADQGKAKSDQETAPQANRDHIAALPDRTKPL